MIRAALLAFSLAVLAGCGFTPVYGPELANSGSIKIPEIQGRTGHFLRQELVRAVGQGVPGLTGSGELEVKLSESINRLGFQPDQAASRSDYTGTVNWTLRKSDGTTLAQGHATQASSFNFANAAYADIAAQTAAQERVASLLAREVRNQLLIEAGKPHTGKAIVTETQTPSSPKPDTVIPGTTSTVVSPVDPVNTPPFKQ